MNIIELADFTKSLDKMLDSNIYFEVVFQGDGVTFHPLADKEFYRFINSIAQLAKQFHEEVGIHDFKELAHQEMQAVISVSLFLEKVVRRYRRKCKKAPFKGPFESIQSYVCALQLGGEISVEEMERVDPEMKTFLKINQFYSKCQRLRLQLKCSWDGGVFIPVEIEPKLFQYVPISKIKKEEIADNKGYRFLLGEHFLFQTDRELRLTENFTLLTDGIAHYHTINSFSLYRTLKESAQDHARRCSLEFVFRKKGIKQLSLLLKREDGSIYSIGIYRGKITSPAKEFFSSPEVPQAEKYEIVLSREEFDQLKKKIEEARCYLSKTYSEIDLCHLVSQSLGKPILPKKALLTSRRWAALTSLPLIFLSYFFHKRSCLDVDWKILFKHPEGLYCLDHKSFKNSLKIASFQTRSISEE